MPPPGPVMVYTEPWNSVFMIYLYKEIFQTRRVINSISSPINLPPFPMHEAAASGYGRRGHSSVKTSPVSHLSKGVRLRVRQCGASAFGERLSSQASPRLRRRAHLHCSCMLRRAPRPRHTLVCRRADLHFFFFRVCNESAP